MPAVFPFYIAHFRAEEAQRLCSAFIDLKTDTLPALPEEMLPFAVKDRTPGYRLCEKHTETGRELLLAARLGEGEGGFSARLPEVLCTYIVPQTGKNAVYIPEVLDRLAACTKPAAVFEHEGAVYTAKPVHDPVACRTITESLAGCELVPLGAETLPPDGTAVLIRFEEAACEFAAGLVLDMP
ncbi:MAG: hypothetical protein IKU17_00770 [Clostridia bacterium]|nr:hypothetical protein [Clostridia bacterium]